MTLQAAFAGRILTQPGSLSVVDSTALNNPQLGYSGIVAIIGSCLSGQPKVPQLFNSPGQLKAALGSGNAYDGARMAFNPSNQLVEGNYVRPQLVYVVRADAATQGYITLDDSLGADSITLTAKDYGVQTNQIGVLVTAPTPNNGNTNAVDIAIRYGTSTESFTNIGMTQVFSMTYTGAGVNTAADVLISSTACTVGGVPAPGIKVTITGADSADSFEAPFSVYPTLKDFREKAVSVSAHYTVAPYVSNEATYQLVNMDYSTTSILVGTNIKFYDVLNQLVTAINNGSALVTAARATTGGSLPPTYPNPPLYSYLANGSTTAPTNLDYDACLTALQQYRVNFVALAAGCVSSTDTTPSTATGAGLADTFTAWLDTMQGENECHGHVGTYMTSSNSVNSTFAVLETLAREINDVNCNLWTDSIMVPNDQGVATWYDSWMTACMAAGFQAGTPPGTSFVQKSFNILNARHYEDTVDLLNPYIYGDQLVLAHLSFMKFNDATKSWNIVRALTTYSADGNDYNIEPGIRSATNYAVYSIRQNIEQKFLGARTLFNQAGSTADSMKNEVLAYGRLLEDANVIVKGTALQNNQIVTLPALVVDNVSISGDIARLRYGIRPIGAVNFIMHTVSLNSVQQVATA